MQLYFDESGDFNPTRRDGQRFSFVVRVIVPETAADALKADFDWFVGQLSPSEFSAKEPKGHLLTLDHRRLLLEVLKAHRNVMLLPVSVNLGRDDPEFFMTAPGKIRRLIESDLETESAFMTFTERAKRIGRLSGPDLVRLMACGIAVLKAIEQL